MEKQLLTRPVKGMGTMLEVYYEGGGEVPEALSGQYTSRSVADTAIKTYLSTRRKKSNGKRSSSSTV